MPAVFDLHEKHYKRKQLFSQIRQIDKIVFILYNKKKKPLIQIFPSTQKVLPAELVAAIMMLQEYAFVCTERKLFCINSDAKMQFKFIVQNRPQILDKLSPWEKELHSVLQNTAKTCVSKELFSSLEDFYETFSEPIRKKEYGVKKLWTIFEIMKVVLKERAAKVPI